MGQKVALSAAVVAQNEAERIGPCLDSLSWVDEIIVVDGGSADGTQNLCRQHGARVIEHPWEGYSIQKNRALGEASHPWVLSVDADERVTEDLRQEIEDLLSGEPACNGYYIPRKNIFWGHWMRGRQFYPDYQMRLIRREKAGFIERKVHESAFVAGPTGKLRGALEHYSYSDLRDYLQRQHHYASLAAEELRERGVRPRWHHLLLRPPARFLKGYVLRGGFVDGLDGLLVAGMDALYVLAKYGRLRELWERNSEGPSPPLDPQR